MWLTWVSLLRVSNIPRRSTSSSGLGGALLHTYFSTPSLPVTTGSLANSEERMMQEVHIAVELGSYARGAELTVGLSARAGHSTLPY